MDRNLPPVTFEFARNLLMFAVKIDGESRQFILDSGSSTMVLNSKYEDDSGMPVPSVLADTSTANMQAKFISLFEWGEMRLTNQVAMVMGLSHLEQQLKRTVHGLIGCAQFANYDLLLDYSSSSVTLIDSFSDVPACMVGAVSIPVTMSQHIPAVPVWIGGRAFSLGLDTGAEQNVLAKEHENYCKEAELIFNVTQDGITRFNPKDSEQEARFCSINAVSIGQAVTIDGMRFVFHDINIPGVKDDGLLGYELFSRYKALIRFAKRELLLLPFQN